MPILLLLLLTQSLQSKCFRFDSVRVESVCFTKLNAGVEVLVDFSPDFFSLIRPRPIRREALASKKQTQNRQFLQRIYQLLEEPTLHGYRNPQVWKLFPHVSPTRQALLDSGIDELSRYRLDYFQSQTATAPQTADLPTLLLRLATEEGTVGLKTVGFEKVLGFGIWDKLEFPLHQTHRTFRFRLPLKQLPMNLRVGLADADDLLIELHPQANLIATHKAYQLLKTPLVLPSTGD